MVVSVFAWREGQWAELTPELSAREAIDEALGWTADARHAQVVDFLVERDGTAEQYRVGAPHASRPRGHGA